MNNKVNYTFVGFLVLFATGLMFAFIYWLMQPSQEEDIQKYNIHFSESVLGLNIDAPVKFRGINVGKVSALRINPKNMEEVEVEISIIKITPIKTDTVAKLTPQGITGLSYINLELGSKTAKTLVLKENEIYPLIKSVPSFYKNIEESLDDVSSQLSSTLTKTQQLLSDDNQRDISLVLYRTANILDKLDMAMNNETILHFQTSMKNLDSISAKVDTMTPNINTLITKSIIWEEDVGKSFNSIVSSYGVIKSSMTEIQRAVASGEFNIKDITKEVLPTMNSTLMDVQELMLRLDSVMQTYEKSPSDILFRQEELKKGPGEK